MFLAEPKKRTQTWIVYQTLARICALYVRFSPGFGEGEFIR